MDVNDAVAFLAVLAFGSLFGAFGAFLALPGAAEAVLLVPGKAGLRLERVTAAELAHSEAELAAE